MSPIFQMFFINFLVMMSIIYLMTFKNETIKKSKLFFQYSLAISIGISLVLIILIQSIGMEFKLVHIGVFIGVVMFELNILSPIIINGNKINIDRRTTNNIVIVTNVIVFAILYLFVL